MTSKNILITGVSGHLGLALLKAAINAKNIQNIYGTVKTKKSFDKMQSLIKKINTFSKNVQIVKLDLLSSDLFFNNILPKDIHIVIHNAASIGSAGSKFSSNRHQEGDSFGSEGFYNSNVLGTSLFYENLSKECSNLENLIYISSGDVYGKLGVQKEDFLPQPISSYGTSKYMGEILTQIFCKTKNINFSIFRVGSIYGPGQKEQKGVNQFLNDIITLKKTSIYGTGNQKRNFPYVMDIANAIFLSLKFEGDLLLNCASSNTHTIKEIRDEVLESYGLFFDKNKIKNEYINKKNKYQDYILDMKKADKLGISLTTKINTGISKQFKSHVDHKELIDIFNIL